MRDRSPVAGHGSNDRQQERSPQSGCCGGWLRHYAPRLLLASAISLVGACCGTRPLTIDLGTPEETVRTFQRAFDQEDGPGVYATLHPEYQKQLGLASDTSQLALERILAAEPFSSRLADGDIESIAFSEARRLARVVVSVSFLWFEERVEFVLRRDTRIEARVIDLLTKEELIADEFVAGAKPPNEIVQLHPRSSKFVYVEIAPTKGVRASLQDRDYELRSFRVDEVWHIVGFTRLSSERAPAVTEEPTPE